jgi:hypothetical protein
MMIGAEPSRYAIPELCDDLWGVAVVVPAFSGTVGGVWLTQPVSCTAKIIATNVEIAPCDLYVLYGLLSITGRITIVMIHMTR